MATANASNARAVLGEIRTPLGVYTPLCLVLLALALTQAPRVSLVPGQVLAGLALWTAMEYVIHRFILHLVPRGALRRFLAGRHLLHHRSPSQHPGLIAARVSLPTAALFFSALALLLSTAFAAALTLGVVLGYLLYEYIHLAIHMGVPPMTPWGSGLAEHHRLHHEGFAGENFAILVPAWDAVWRTRHRAGKSASLP